jgi:heme/copper-type cytochrome/quinol oxidase subunit 1
MTWIGPPSYGNPPRTAPWKRISSSTEWWQASLKPWTNVLYGIYKLRRQNPGKETPLGVWGVFTTIMIWLLAAPPLAYLVLIRLVPT